MTSSSLNLKVRIPKHYDVDVKPLIDFKSFGPEFSEITAPTNTPVSCMKAKRMKKMPYERDPCDFKPYDTLAQFSAFYGEH